MTTHEQLLARIERQVASDGARLNEIDARAAEELDVPPDYYFAYLLVWSAIERHRELLVAQTGLPIGTDEVGGTPLQRAQSLADTIGWAASRIYGETAGDGHQEINTAAADLLGAAMQLRTSLRQLEADRDVVGPCDPSAHTRDRGVSIDGR